MFFELKEFGGEYPALDDKDLPVNFATYALDCDLSLGKIAPFKTDMKVSDKTGVIIWSDDCCYLTDNDCNVSFAQVDIGCNYVFKTLGRSNDGKTHPFYASYDNACQDKWCRMDWPECLSAPNASALSGVSQEFSMEPVSVVYTLVNQYGHETPPSLPSQIFDINDSANFIVSGLPDADDGFCWVTVRIYATRTTYEMPNTKTQVADGFFLLQEVAFGTTSSVVNYGKPITAVLTDDNDTAPTALWDISHGRSGYLSALYKNTLRFSDRLQWLSWPEEYEMQVPGTALRHLAGEDWAYVLTDERYLAVKLDNDGKNKCHTSKMSADILPIISQRSAAMWGDKCVWATTEGLVMALGAQYSIVSRPWFDTRAWHAINPDELIGVVHNGHYFGVTDQLCFRMALPNSLQAEHKATGGFVRLSINPKAWFVTRDNKLLFSTDDGIYEWNAGDEFKPYAWERKSWHTPGSVNLSSYTLDWKYGSLSKVEHTIGDKTWSIKAPYTRKEPSRLPVCRSSKFGLRIEGTSEVSSYKISTSIEEIK